MLQASSISAGRVSKQWLIDNKDNLHKFHPGLYGKRSGSEMKTTSREQVSKLNQNWKNI